MNTDTCGYLLNSCVELGSSLVVFLVFIPRLVIGQAAVFSVMWSCFQCLFKIYLNPATKLQLYFFFCRGDLFLTKYRLLAAIV